MEKTNEHIDQQTSKVLHIAELSTLENHICAELKRIGCGNINSMITPHNELVFTAKKVPTIRLSFDKDGIKYGVLIHEISDDNESYRFALDTNLMCTFDDNEKIPFSSLSVCDTLTVTEQTEEGTKLRLVHRVSDLITYKRPCDTDIAAELVARIFEISKL